MTDFAGEAKPEDLIAVLRIGHNTSMRGAGLSLRDALSRARYRELRPHFEVSDLVPLLRSHPALIEEWLQYSEDKRTSGGWYVLRDGTIGQLMPHAEIRFSALHEAVAAYVVRELDFWANLSAGD